ncbi:MAG: hypothetical protein U0M51_02140 [Eggerthellaceae bacterium]
MPSGGVVAKAWVQVIPEMSGIQREIAAELGGVDEQAAKAGSSSGSGFSKAFKGAVAAIGGIVAAAGISQLVEQAAQTQSVMSRLTASAQKNGVAADSMKSAYGGLVGVLGETDRAVEASGNLFALCGDNQAQLKTMTTALTGAFSQFGDGMPIETLAEAANETARCGTVVGSMADALNWVNASTDQWSAALSGNSAAQSAFNSAVAQGASKEDAFNAALAACSTEGERQQLVVSTLSALYGEAGQSYMDANKALIEYNQSQDALSSALSGLGGALMPIKTEFNNLAAEIVNGVVPALQMMASGDVSGGVDALVQTLSGAASKILEALPAIVQAASGIASGLVTALGQMLSDPANITMMVQGFVQLFNAIVQAIPQIITAISTALPQLVMGIAQVLTNGECIMSIINAFIQLFISWWQALPQIIATITPMIPQIVTMLGQALIQNAPALLQAAVQLFMSLLTALAQLVPQLLSSLGQLLVDAGSKIASGAGQMLDSAGQMFQGLIDGAARGIEDFMGKVGEIPGKIADFFADAGSWLLDAGASIINGLGEGISNAVGGVIGTVSDVVSQIRGFFPFSPAKRGPFSGRGYTTWSGKALIEDWGAGMESGARSAVDYASEAASRVRAAISASGSGSSSSGSPYVEGTARTVVNQTFNTRVVRADEDLYSVAPIIYRNAAREARLMRV